MIDCVLKGRHGTAKLTTIDVAEIRKLYADGKGRKGLAKMFQVSAWTIYSIIKGTCWAHVIGGGK